MIEVANMKDLILSMYQSFSSIVTEIIKVNKNLSHPFITNQKSLGRVTEQLSKSIAKDINSWVMTFHKVSKSYKQSYRSHGQLSEFLSKFESLVNYSLDMTTIGDQIENLKDGMDILYNDWSRIRNLLKNIIIIYMGLRRQAMVKVLQNTKHISLKNKNKVKEIFRESLSIVTSISKKIEMELCQRLW